jgi:eukaryotic-like serine/threonine-protein kinase
MSTMSPSREQVKALFFDALEQPPSQQAAWLRAETRDDEALYAAVAELLDFHDDAPLIQDTPAPAAVGFDPLGISGAGLDDRFTVGPFVAEGGFAHVYRGLDGAGESVALKLFKPVSAHNRAEHEQAFRREADVLMRLASAVPTMVQPRGLGRCAGPQGAELVYLAMEWLDGDVLRLPGGGGSLSDALTHLRPIADAVADAHDLGIAHRDLKPGNIFVQADGRLRLLDFGIAKVAADRTGGFESTATASGGFTLDYAAPEQLVGEATGPWTDVYALAVLLVAWQRGTHPYAELSPFEVMMKLVDPVDRPTPRRLGLPTSGAIDMQFEAALAIPPAERPDLRSFWSELTQAAS